MLVSRFDRSKLERQEAELDRLSRRINIIDSDIKRLLDLSRSSADNYTKLLDYLGLEMVVGKLFSDISITEKHKDSCAYKCKDR